MDSALHTKTLVNIGYKIYWVIHLLQTAFVTAATHSCKLQHHGQSTERRPTTAFLLFYTSHPFTSHKLVWAQRNPRTRISCGEDQMHIFISASVPQLPTYRLRSRETGDSLTISRCADILAWLTPFLFLDCTVLCFFNRIFPRWLIRFHLDVHHIKGISYYC